jgi:L-rhamnose mutarotase
MKYFGLTLNLKNDPGAIEAYKEYHRRVFPEVERSLRRVGILKMRIFLHGRRLFMYIEVADDFDPSTYGARYLEEPRAVEWENLMRQFQEPLPDAKPGEWWAFMEPVYQLEASGRE